MRRPAGDPVRQRWVERSGRGRDVDDRIGALLRDARDAAPVADAVVIARVASRLPAARARSRPAGRLRWAVALVVLGSGGAVFARLLVEARQAATLPAVGPREAPKTRRLVVPPPAVASEPAAPTSAVAPEPAGPVAPELAAPARPRAPARRLASSSRRSRPSQVAGQPVVAADEPAPNTMSAIPDPSRPFALPVVPDMPPQGHVAPDDLGAEAAVLRGAIMLLRQDHDPAGALDALDEHRARFPHGVLGPDADLLRVDALLALGQRDRALALLESQRLEDNPRADELLVTRGELRAERDCPRALPDFDRVLARARAARLRERALRGHALCRLRQGDHAAADADLRRYLALFPGGPLADEARTRLGDC